MDDTLATRARRALELGRARSALASALLVTLALAVLTRLAPGLEASWLALPFAAWALVIWRGGALARGGMAGLVAGAAGWLVPMSVLRPCCAATSVAHAGMDCCTRPECCLEAGVLLGAVVGLALPLARGRRASAESIAGTLLVAGATLGVRCAGLFAGESLGLLGGLALGGILAGGVRVAFAPPVAA